MSMEIRYAARSDVGLLRELNEDAAYAGPRLIAVADGMGGHAAGEVASAVAIAALAELDRDEASDADPRELLRGAVFGANRALREMVAADPELDGMGTTVTALLVERGELGLVHVGDSRGYRLRAGELVQVTRDHTLVQRLVDEGSITVEEAGVHPLRSRVTRALDGRDSLELDLSVHDLVPGDRYLLCSDGLPAVVSDETIRESLQLEQPMQAVDRLVELALRGGAPDNVTCVVADVVDTDATKAVPVSADATVRVIAGSAAEGPQAAPRPQLREPTTTGELPRQGETDHAAGRAASLRHTGVTERAQHVRRRQRRLAALAFAALAVLAGIGGWRYLQSQYYVAVDGSDVAIFRGIDGTFAGVDMSRVTDDVRVPVGELGEFQRRQAQAGINAASLADARDIVARLTIDSAAVPPGQPAQPTPEVSPGPTPELPSPPAIESPPLVETASAPAATVTGPSPTAGTP